MNIGYNNMLSFRSMIYKAENCRKGLRYRGHAIYYYNRTRRGGYGSCI